MKRRHASPGRFVRMLLYALPVTVVGTLVVVYHQAPDLYHRALLSIDDSEHQIVELFTFVCALVAAGMLARSAVGLWRVRRTVRVRGGAVIITIVAMAALFFAGEEVNWGQELLEWDTPADQRDRPPTNLHEMEAIPIGVETLANAFLVAVFFVLPAATRFDRRDCVPRSWKPAIAERPVVFCVAIAFAWGASRSVYQAAHTGWDTDPGAHPWAPFFELVPEHKEMLVALALLMYGVHRLRAVAVARRSWQVT